MTLDAGNPEPWSWIIGSPYRAKQSNLPKEKKYLLICIIQMLKLIMNVIQRKVNALTNHMEIRITFIVK